MVKEWEHVNASIHTMGDYKFKIRGWFVAIFSGILVLSITQQQGVLLIVAGFVVLFFWIFDAMHQVAQHVFYKREREIEPILNDPTDENLLRFKSPDIRDNFSDGKLFRESLLKSILGIYRVYLFGSTLLFLILFYGFL